MEFLQNKNTRKLTKQKFNSNSKIHLSVKIIDKNVSKIFVSTQSKNSRNDYYCGIYFFLQEKKQIFVKILTIFF